MFPSLDDHLLEVRRLPGGVQDFCKSVEQAANIASSDKTRNVYFGPVLRSAEKGDEEHARLLSSLWVDLDVLKDFGGDWKRAGETVAGFEHRPSCVINTGNGWHLYWFLREPELIEPEDRPRIRGILKGVSETLGGDKTWDLARVMRVPNSLNLKDRNSPRAVKILKWLPENRYNLSDFEPYKAESDGRASAPPLSDRIPDHQRNVTLTSLGGTMRRRGMSEEGIAAGLLIENRKKCDPPLPESEVCGIAHSVARYAPEPSLSPIYIDDGDNGPVTFNPIPFSKLLEEASDVSYLVDKIIPTGTSGVLGGAPGEGKSFLVAELAIAVATGTPWMGEFGTSQGHVLVIDSENSLPLLRRRGLKLLRGRGLQESGNLNIEYLVSSGMNLSDPSHVAGLEALLEDRRPALVLIDSLVRVHRAAENSATEMAAVFGEIKRLVDTFGCVFLFTHHSRKLGMYNDASQLLRGSSEIKAFVDTYLFLRKVGGVLRVEHDKARYDEPVPNFIVEIEDPPDVPDATIVSYVGEAQADGQDRQQEAEDFVLDIMAEGQLSRQEILKRAKENKLSATSIDRALKALVEADQVDRGQEGREVYFNLKKRSSPSSLYIDDDNHSDGSPDWVVEDSADLQMQLEEEENAQPGTDQNKGNSD